MDSITASFASRLHLCRRTFLSHFHQETHYRADCFHSYQVCFLLLQQSICVLLLRDISPDIFSRALIHSNMLFRRWKFLHFYCAFTSHHVVVWDCFCDGGKRQFVPLLNICGKLFFSTYDFKCHIGCFLKILWEKKCLKK